MHIRTKSVLKDVRGNLVTIEDELVDDDGKVVKTKKIQLPLKDYNPRVLWEARSKNFRKSGKLSK